MPLAPASHDARRTVGSLLTALLVGAATTLSACGSATIHELPPAAEPARAPELTKTPAGDVVPIGGMPEGIVVDPQTHLAAVALRAPDRLRIMRLAPDGDDASARIVRDVALPGAPRHLSLRETPSGSQVLVPAETAKQFLAVDLPTGKIAQTAPTGDHPHDLTAITGGRVAIGDERANTLTVVGPGGQEERTISVATQPGGVTSLRDGKLIAVVSVRERVLELFDAVTLRRLAVAPAGVGPTHVVCAPTGPCFVADTEGDAVLVFRVGADGSLRLTRRVYVAGAPYGIAIDPERRRLWVTLTARNELVELPAHRRPHIIQRLPTVRQPDTVAVDTSTGDVAVTGRTNGVLQVLRDPASPDN